mmetsp:Transcript_40159/g.99247  ORF Transcript_40159/g.99247 Transcript_40159/m.99247 type:complete len:234 (+) Transcript_40159:167-868(+)
MKQAGKLSVQHANSLSSSSTHKPSVLKGSRVPKRVLTQWLAAPPDARTRAAYLPFSPSLSSWSCVPFSSTRPSPTYAILSALRMVESRCAITSVVRLFAASSASSAACTTRSLSVSSAEVASSRMSTTGFLITARAIATRCFCPPDSWPPPCPARVSKPAGKDMMKPCALALLAAASISACVAPGLPYAMFSAMVPSKSTGSCPTIPICCRSHLSCSVVMSAPSSSTEPPDGS